MAVLSARNIAVSLDGYMAGPNQSVDAGLGEGGEQLHEWVFATRGGREMIGQTGGHDGVDQRFFEAGFENIGANIMGRNMYGPIRGEWNDTDWKGWWGDNPPYHSPVYVLTHYPHEPIEMDGGTTFSFVTDGIESALQQAFEAAGGKDVRLNGGASTIQQYMRAGLLDDLHVAVSPILLGAGELLFDNLGDAAKRYEIVEVVPGEGATHYRLQRR